MKWYTDSKLSTKLFIGFSLLLVVAGLMAFFGVSNMGKINTMLNAMYDNNLMPIAHISEANGQSIAKNRALYRIVLEDDVAAMAELKRLADERQVSIDENWALYVATDLS
ncbi:MAG: MCP four helix bundle domain-containing protein, partial [Candidatus Hydrogenedentes bacterium]|nr:MCP four helix bundle domain-containing protein [Candidatus Hydrogenedentota bacterium]